MASRSLERETRANHSASSISRRPTSLGIPSVTHTDSRRGRSDGRCFTVSSPACEGFHVSPPARYLRQV
jgi:hypothetical protein